MLKFSGPPVWVLTFAVCWSKLCLAMLCEMDMSSILVCARHKSCPEISKYHGYRAVWILELNSF